MTGLGRALVLALVGALLTGGASTAQEPGGERILVELRVTTITGDGVYVDGGRDAGLQAGDLVRLLPLAGAGRDGTVRAVSSRAARVEVQGELGGLRVGDRVEAWIPAERLAEGAGVEGARPDVPTHAPWEYPPEEWSTDMPLLAPVTARKPKDRELELDGRAFVRGELGSDDQDGSDHQLLWVGGGLDVSNPFGRGGELQLDADAFARSFDDAESDDDERRLRVDRLSYRWGGDRTRSDRYELGRFLQHGVPELGLLDGVEWERRLPSGDRFGVSAGLLPSWDDAASTGDDTQVAAFYRYAHDARETLSSTLAYQKTWHEGAADRDLLLWSADWLPTERTRVSGATWVDLYSSGDERSGAELTQLLLSATHRFESGNGLGLIATRYRWPELDTDGLFDGTPQDVEEVDVSRLAVHGWRALSSDLRLDGRASVFSDEDDSGSSVETGVTARDLLFEGGSTSLHVYAIDGKTTSGLGARATATKVLGRAFLRLHVDVTDYEEEGLGDDDSLLRNRTRLSYDHDLGSGWSLSAYGERSFGDQQDSSTLGFTLQRRF